MNLFENLQLMKENSTFESQVDYEVLKQNDIDFFENGMGIYRVTTPDGDTLDIDIELSKVPIDRPKYFVSLPSEDVRSVNADLTTAIIDVINKLNNFPMSKGPKRKSINESTDKDKLWTDFNRHFNGFIPLNDLTNYFSLDQFGEFTQWCRKEADLDYDYNKVYRNWDEVFKDLYDATGSENTDSISMENIFNFFSTGDLEDFWEWIEKEYGLDDELEESKHLKEYKSNINNKTELWHEMFRYTDEPFVLFKDLFNCYSIDDLQDLYDYLSSEYEDEEFAPYKGKLNSIDELWDEMNKLVPNEKVAFNDLFNCYSLDKLKKLYDYLSSEYSDVDDLEESIKLEKLSIGNKLQTIFDKFDSNIKLVGFMLQYIDEDTIEKMYNEIAEVEEATSSIGGAYTTKAIDIIPTGIKKSKEIVKI